MFPVTQCRSFCFILGKVHAVLARRRWRVWSVSCDHSKKRSVRQVYNPKVYCEKGIWKFKNHKKNPTYNSLDQHQY